MWVSCRRGGVAVCTVGEGFGGLLCWSQPIGEQPRCGEGVDEDLGLVIEAVAQVGDDGGCKRQRERIGRGLDGERKLAGGFGFGGQMVASAAEPGCGSG